MKNKFNVVDMIKIEEYIKTLDKDKISLRENLTEKLNIDREFYNKVNLYFIKAIQVPYEKILNKLYEYDKSSPKYDEILFIDELCKEFNVDKTIILKRIREVRKIEKYIKKNKLS